MTSFSLLEKVLIAAVAVLGVAVVVLVVLLVIETEGGGGDADRVTDTTLRAICNLQPQSSNNVTGVVKFEQKQGEKISINVTITGVPSNSQRRHGFHVHGSGDITTCGTTGGHYNPGGVDHAGPTESVRHTGDFGNIPVPSNGEIQHTFTDPVASLFGEDSIIGRAIVLHAGVDDLGKGTGSAQAGSLASGNAGARLACCVIGRLA